MTVRAPSPSDAAATKKMRANRRRDTAPERALRCELHRRGLRFFVDRPVPTTGRSVRPDLVFPRTRVAVFVDGCFWHACPIHGTQPKANSAYWAPKLVENVERDQRNTKALQDAGWLVVRVWEHVITDRAADLVEHAVTERALQA
jgi:DNA mismatch endonuclease (patch repair protein)